MRRAFALLLVFLIIMCISLPASAASSATSGDLAATVYADGSCQITLRLTLRLDSAGQKLIFPVPANAYAIQVNGGGASARRNGQVMEIDLSRAIGDMAGTASVTLSYSLPNIIVEEEEDEQTSLLLRLPMLCGFPLAVENLRFSVTLPGDFPGRPTFISTYYQTRIEEDIVSEVQGSHLSGGITRSLMGGDWLTMELAVTDAMFPQDKPIVWTLGVPELAMTILGVLSLLYWLIFLRALPPRFQKRSSAPDGIGAGELAPALTMGKADLTMMVVQWAQLGYIHIQINQNGRILLQKRMTMGNERSQYENRIFRALFGSKNIIDGTGLHYAQLCRKVAAGSPGVHGLFKPQSGNPLVFRVLSALIAVFGGYAVGLALGGDSVLRGVIGVATALAGGISGWIIQDGCAHAHLRRKYRFWISLALCAGWMILGFVVNTPRIAGWLVIAELLGGFSAAYGGRRTEMGRLSFSQILGLRRQLAHMDSATVQTITRSNPDYFYSLMPYALALGVDSAFARAFGGKRLGACPYLTGGTEGSMTAAEWSSLLRDAVSAMDERQRQLFWERLTGR